MIADFWPKAAVIAENNFIHKSLSNWSYNIAVGCEHACRFCYVPDASTKKLGKMLEAYGVNDPDAQWGAYVLLRQWDPLLFDASLRGAETTKELKPDGNRAVMLCTTTDPYQTINGGDLEKTKLLSASRSYLVREALRRIRDHTLNVRILTRSPLARLDFELMKSFGDRLLFGMSIPTLNNDLARVYEPHAPAPSQRLETLRLAKKMGLNVFVAAAPVYPECDEADMKRLLEAIAPIDPVTLFMEPINIRAENVKRIEAHARLEGVELKTEVFSTPAKWREYALDQMVKFQYAADDFGLCERVHLWPDASLGSADCLKQFADRAIDDGEGGIPLKTWLECQWEKISDWPGQQKGRTKTMEAVWH